MNIITPILSVLALAIAGFAAFGQPATPQFGASAGPTHTERQFFLNDAIIGGGNFATSSAGAATYAAAEVMNNRTITHTATGALTATLPASTTLNSYIPRTGDTKTVFLLPVTNTITLAGGTGTDLNTASTTLNCTAGKVCRLDFVRRSNTDIEVLLQNP